MKVLVTGGAGFIGSHLVDRLSFLNHEVFIIDNLSTGSADNLNLEFKNLFKVDICNKEHITQIFDYVKPDVVYHLAAQINVRDSISNPIKDAEINTIGTLNILNECVRHKIKKIIFSSSGGAIYQDNDQLIKTENSVIDPVSPYGISKWTGEQYINFYKKIYGLDSTILRFSNVYGSNRQISKSEAGVISIFINNMINDNPLTIFGSGLQTRDYIDVYSVVDALELSLKISGTYNVSTGIATPLIDIANILCNKFNKSEIIYQDKVDGELMHNCLSSSSLRSYGWKPLYSLEEGIDLAIKSFKQKMRVKK